MMISKHSYEKQNNVKLTPLTLEDLTAHSREVLVVKVNGVGYFSATLKYVIGSDDLNYIEFQIVDTDTTIHVKLKDIDEQVFVRTPK